MQIDTTCESCVHQEEQVFVTFLGIVRVRKDASEARGPLTFVCSQAADDSSYILIFGSSAVPGF